MSDAPNGFWRKILDALNDEWQYEPLFVVFKWFLLTLGLLAVGAIGSCQASYWLYDLPSQPAVIACQARGMNAGRPDFSREVTCLPRYRGADSLNATVEAK